MEGVCRVQEERAEELSRVVQSWPSVPASGRSCTALVRCGVVRCG